MPPINPLDEYRARFEESPEAEREPGRAIGDVLDEIVAEDEMEGGHRRWSYPGVDRRHDEDWGTGLAARHGPLGHGVPAAIVV